MGFFSRRRDRESALPPSSSPKPYKPLADQPVVGQQFTTAGQQAMPFQFDMSGGMDVAGIMGMVHASMQAAQMQAGGMQAPQSEAHVVNAGGSDLGKQLVDVMKAHGVDPETANATGPIDASSMPAMQADMLQVLQQNGIDVGDASGFTIESGSSDSGSGGFDSGSSDGGGSSGGE